MTLSYHVQALDTQQHKFKLRLEAVTTVADNHRAVLLTAQRSVIHWHSCYVPWHCLQAIYVVWHNT